MTYVVGFLVGVCSVITYDFALARYYASEHYARKIEGKI